MVAVDKTEFLWCAPLKSVFLNSSEVLYVEVLFTTQYRHWTHCVMLITLHKKWNFLLRNFSVNVTNLQFSETCSFRSWRSRFSEAYSEPCQTSKMESFAEIGNKTLHLSYTFDRVRNTPLALRWRTLVKMLKTPQNLGLKFFRASWMNWNFYFVYLMPLANHMERFFNQRFIQ